MLEGDQTVIVEEADAIHIDGESLVSVVEGIFGVGRVVPDEREAPALIRNAFGAKVAPATVTGAGRHWLDFKQVVISRREADQVMQDQMGPE
jgi:hypothetical protein